MRVGIGVDVHRFDKARRLVLGGVEIPAGPGLAGHSDADVVCHAIADAVLGAANLGDLGTHFPDTDEWSGASSLTILERVAEMTGGVISSVDASVIIEVPKIAPYRDEMRARIAKALGMNVEKVSVKATTTDGLGLVGRGEGVACIAVALIDD